MISDVDFCTATQLIRSGINILFFGTNTDFFILLQNNIVTWPVSSDTDFFYCKSLFYSDNNDTSMNYQWHWSPVTRYRRHWSLFQVTQEWQHLLLCIVMKPIFLATVPQCFYKYTSKTGHRIHTYQNIYTQCPLNVFSDKSAFTFTFNNNKIIWMCWMWKSVSKCHISY